MTQKEKAKLVPVSREPALLTERDADKSPVLECIDLGITFGGLKAVDNFNVTIGRTEITGLIGPNGAGKTTVFNLLTKVYQPTHGTILLNGKDIHDLNTAQVNRAGIARTFQNIRLFGDMSVEQNITVAMDNQVHYTMPEGILRLPRFWKEERVMHERAMELLSIFHMEHLADAKASSLPYGAQRRLEILRALAQAYPAECSLQYQKDYELLFAVRLAAQCTDERVNQITPALFARFPTLEAFAAAEPEDVEPYVRSCGFFRAKARDIVLCARKLVAEYGGRVPDTMEALTSLPGVGRKTANLILGDVYHKPAVVVDTHCIRLSNRMGLVDGLKDPVKIETALRKILPPEESSDFCHRLVLHGRAVCTARKPQCSTCCVRHVCQTAEEMEL